MLASQMSCLYDPQCITRLSQDKVQEVEAMHWKGLRC